MKRPVLSLLLLLALPAGAADLADGKLTINGFGGWMTGLSNGNHYGYANPLGSDTMAEFALAVIARPVDPLTVYVQPYFLVTREGAEAELDWAYAEWRFSDLARLRLGKAKMPMGLYGEIQDVGTMRPFLMLPMGVYGPSEMFTESMQGVSLTGRVESERGWGVEYDAWLGNLSYHVASPLPGVYGGGAEQGAQPSQALGSRLALLTPLEGFRVLVSGALGRQVPEEDATLEAGEGEESPLFGFVGLSAEYMTPALTLRAEVFTRMAEEDGATQTGFLEAAYFVTERIQLGVRGELFLSSPPGIPADSLLLSHRALEGTVNYWFSRNLVFKLSYGNIYGNRFAYSADYVADHQDGSLKPRTQLVQLGAQFAF